MLSKGVSRRSRKTKFGHWITLLIATAVIPSANHPRSRDTNLVAHWGTRSVAPLQTAFCTGKENRWWQFWHHLEFANHGTSASTCLIVRNTDQHLHGCDHFSSNLLGCGLCFLKTLDRSSSARRGCFWILYTYCRVVKRAGSCSNIALGVLGVSSIGREVHMTCFHLFWLWASPLWIRQNGHGKWRLKRATSLFESLRTPFPLWLVFLGVRISFGPFHLLLCIQCFLSNDSWHVSPSTRGGHCTVPLNDRETNQFEICGPSSELLVRGSFDGAAHMWCKRHAGCHFWTARSKILSAIPQQKLRWHYKLETWLPGPLDKQIHKKEWDKEWLPALPSVSPKCGKAGWCL